MIVLNKVSRQINYVNRTTLAQKKLWAANCKAYGYSHGPLENDNIQF